MESHENKFTFIYVGNLCRVCKLAWWSEIIQQHKKIKTEEICQGTNIIFFLNSIFEAEKKIDTKPAYNFLKKSGFINF